MFNFSDLTSMLNHIIKKGAESRLTDSQFIVKEISNFKNSQKKGRYAYRGKVFQSLMPSRICSLDSFSQIYTLFYLHQYFKVKELLL